MKKIIKNNLKVVLAIIITAIICISTTAYAITKIYARDITFTATNENFTATNVEDAINELYENASNIDLGNLYFRHDTDTKLTIPTKAKKYIMFGYSYGQQWWNGARISTVDNGTYKLLKEEQASEHLFIFYEIIPIDENETITVNTITKSGSIFVVPIGIIE